MNGRRLLNPPGLGLPPAIQMMLSKEPSDFVAESGFVALLSLTQRTRPSRATSSMRCGRPLKLGMPRTASSGVSPRARTAA